MRRHIQGILRVLLPVRYHGFEQLQELAPVILAALGIPSDETFERFVFRADRTATISQRVDRDGMTDRLY